MKYATKIALAVLLFATACTHDKQVEGKGSDIEKTEIPQTKSTSEQKTKTFSNNTLTVSSYSKFPTEIDGCSCYYSTSKAEFKKGNWIYTFDSQITAFMNIEGEMNRIRMSQSLDHSDGSSEKKLSNEDYNFVVNVNQVGKVDETVQHSGTITITSKKDSRTYNSPIYGECGC